MSRGRHVVVMARRPAWGRVKTRLAAGIGPGAALAVYRRGLSATLRRLGRDPRWRTLVAVTPAAAARRPGRWARGLPVIAQADGDLGRRMIAAIDAMPPGPVVVVGCDIPDLRARHVAAAFRALERHDAVFGPAGDGGYWLLGLAPSLRGRARLDGVRWSGPHALADSRARLPAGCRVALLETLCDIDDAEDLRQWRTRHRRVYGGGRQGEP